MQLLFRRGFILTFVKLATGANNLGLRDAMLNGSEFSPPSQEDYDDVSNFSSVDLLDKLRSKRLQKRLTKLST
jgi:hypothetical protein